MNSLLSSILSNTEASFNIQKRNLQHLLQMHPEVAPLVQLLLTEESSVITGAFGSFVGENSYNAHPCAPLDYLQFVWLFVANEILEAAHSGISFYVFGDDGYYAVVGREEEVLAKGLDGEFYALDKHPYICKVALSDETTTTLEAVYAVVKHHRTKRNEYLKGWDEVEPMASEQVRRIDFAKSLGLCKEGFNPQEVI